MNCTEKHMRIALLNDVWTVYNVSNYNKCGRANKGWNERVFVRKIVLPSGFEPESKPREGFMIGRYTTGAVRSPIQTLLINISRTTSAGCPLEQFS